MNFLRSKRKAFLLLSMLMMSGMASAQVVIKGNIYGGGELGKVTQNTNVTFNTGGTVKGDIYGGGKGQASDEESGLVKGNTKVEMTGGRVESNVYGGGQLGSVGDFTETYETAEGLHVAGEPKECAENTGSPASIRVQNFFSLSL